MGTRPRVALYSPYIPKHVGGGERYLLSVAEYFSHSHETFILVREKIDEKTVRQKYEDAFHLDLSKVEFKQTLIGTGASLFDRLRETAQYDILYYLTDGSLFFSLARKNILHIQFPFTFAKPEFSERLKLMNWSVKNTNSQFTKQVVEKAWHTKIGFVHEPYIDNALFAPGKKENIIVSVGRFFTGLHCKRQDVLVESFRRLVRGGLSGWRLVLIGPIEPGVENAAYTASIADAAKGLPIKIFHDASFDVLRQYYAAARIYWHAAGFEIDEQKEPLKVEHFGISTLEAMSSGAVPIVVGKGGQKEIVEDGKSGFFWQTTEELATHTKRLMSDDDLQRQMSLAARERAMQFDKTRFIRTLEEMLK
ncbi:MAG TPA: glycosyltransferase family 4 protein [Candidatus Saccharimonadia bacterium]|nr:glycosyltransferase family 4 protein [Candidatus Saccharimonadia bacterium]